MGMHLKLSFHALCAPFNKTPTEGKVQDKLYRGSVEFAPKMSISTKCNVLPVLLHCLQFVNENFFIFKEKGFNWTLGHLDTLLLSAPSAPVIEMNFKDNA